MAEDTIPKKTRSRKTAPTPTETPTPTPSARSDIHSGFQTLIQKIYSAQSEYEQTIRQIQELNIAHQRERETYEYETLLVHRKTEDEFISQKAAWEKVLLDEKDNLVAERKELDTLRKQVSSFPAETDRTVKEACVSLQKQLESQFATEKKSLELSHKAEKDLLSLRLETLLSETSRQAKEIESLKSSLAQATDQIKQIAVKVIESGSSPKPAI